MTALTRIAHKIFGSNAPLDEIGQFGSAVATTKLNTKDVATIQNLPAYENGWGSAVVSNNNYPALEEMTGAMNVMSYQTGYLFERGIPEWLNTATYYTNCFCSLNGKIYVSLVDNNTGHDPSNSSGYWSLAPQDTLTKNQITNCILEDPQNIKLTLSNGTLTLKAGSVVCVPNGFESDGVTPKFDEVTVASDISTTYSDGSQYVFYTKNNGTDFGVNQLSTCNSGATDTGVSWHLWYDTANNIIQRKNGSTVLENNCSFPVCIYYGASSTITSIDQTFQSIGYIGSTVFVRKGLKVLIPNGRNADGSLRNIEYTTSKVFTNTHANSNTGELLSMLKSTSVAWYSKFYTIYKENENINYDTYANNPIDRVAIASYSTTNGVISNFQPYTATNILKYSDVDINACNSPYLKTTYVNGGSGYRIWADGYCEQWGIIGYSASGYWVGLPKTYTNLDYNIQLTRIGITGYESELYRTDHSTNGFRVNTCWSSGGQTSWDGVFWRTSGYLASDQY